MIFYFLISIVFIAELIIAFAFFITMHNFDKKLKEYNSLLSDLKPLIKDIAITYRKLSEQMLLYAPKFVNKIKAVIYNMIKEQLKSAIGLITFWLVKTEVEKRL